MSLLFSALSGPRGGDTHMRKRSQLSARIVHGVRKHGQAEKLSRSRPVDWSTRALKPLQVEETRTEAERLLATPPELVGSATFELVAAEDTEEEQTQERLLLRDTLAHPDVISVDAAEQRAEVATRAGVLSQALDAAATASAANSLERMLTHHMAAAHVHGMELLARAAQHGEVDSLELARLTNAASRLFEVFQSGALALLKLRTGGQQRVVVEHQTVNVGPGAQAVVAHRLKGGTRKAKSRPNRKHQGPMQRENSRSAPGSREGGRVGRK